MCKVSSQYRLAKLASFFDAALKKFGMQAFDLQGSWHTARHGGLGLSVVQKAIFRFHDTNHTLIRYTALIHQSKIYPTLQYFISVLDSYLLFSS